MSGVYALFQRRFRFPVKMQNCGILLEKSSSDWGKFDVIPVVLVVSQIVLDLNPANSEPTNQGFKDKTGIRNQRNPCRSVISIYSSGPLNQWNKN